MTLRVAAGLALAVGIGMLFSYFYWIGESPISGGDERHLREMKERTFAPDTVVPYSFAAFVALPHGRPLVEFAAIERRGVSLEGYVEHAELSSDGDYHLSLGPPPPHPPTVPSPTPPPSSTVFLPILTAELTPRWQRGSTTWQWEPLLAALRPQTRGGLPWPSRPRRVRVSGWLLYDFQYDEPFLKNQRPHLPAATPYRLTGWEIHPVTRLELWDDSLLAFVEYPR